MKDAQVSLKFKETRKIKSWHKTFMFLELWPDSVTTLLYDSLHAKRIWTLKNPGFVIN